MKIPYVRSIRAFFTKEWKRFRSFSRRTQIIIGIIVLLLIVGITVLARSGGGDTSTTSVPTVTVQRVDSFGNTMNGVNVLGIVQSVSEANLLAQSAGTVEAVHTKLGANVPAGFVIASLDSAAASASVLQAQGGYDAAVAAAKATTLQAQDTTGSFAEAQTAARNTYQSTYGSLQTAITVDVDQVFGNNTPTGPALAIDPLSTGDTFPRERRDISTLLETWQASLATVNTNDPLTLLNTAQNWLTTVSSFITGLTNLASMQGSGVTQAQLTALATAQSSVNTLLANVSAARDAYNAKQTAAAVSQTQGANANSGTVTSAEANVESALGALRAAQAAYEKTVIRAPIAGTVNFLPITVGDFVSSNEHVATVARNNALEVMMQLSQDDSNRLSVGDTVTIQNTYKGIVTTISPALNPDTKQIEVHVAVTDGSGLVNGQSVQVALPTLPTETAAASATSTRAVAIELPLTAVKLLPNERDVFSVDATGHLVAHPVTIGDVIGDRIIVTTSLPPDLEIVTDARGLSSGDTVQISTSTTQTQ